MKVEFLTGEPLETYPQSPLLPPFDPVLLRRQRPNVHCLVWGGHQAVARASLWWDEVPALDGERLGVIGHFAAWDQASGGLLLSRSLTRLAHQNCTLAVGPMDANTWHRYRFVTEPGSEPPFFLEPENPSAYPSYFINAGFAPVAKYTSTLVNDLTAQDPRMGRTIKRFISAGVKWRPIAMERFADELKAIYRLSVQSFAQNFLYTPISEAEFLAQYQLLAPYVKPELTLLAEHAAELLGYLFGIPDLNQAQRGEPVDTFIVKTVAVLPGRRSAGLGSLLVAESHRIAHAQGYRRAVHALMHEGNQSQNISARYSRTMRRYTLYRKRLGTRS